MSDSWLRGRLDFVVLANDCAYFAVGMLSNLTLLYLIQRRTPPFLKPYAKVLTIHCVSDIFNEFVMFFMGVQTMPMNERMYFLPSGILPNPNLNPYITQLQCGMYTWIVISLPIGLATLDFGYRWLLICRQTSLTMRQLILYVLFVYFATFILGGVIGGGFAFVVDPREVPEWQKEECRRGLGGLQEVPIYCVSHCTQGGALIVMVTLNIMIVVDYTFISYVVREVGKKMQKEMSGREEASQRAAQRQITMIMLVQASIPLLLCIPAGLSISCCFFKWELPNLGRGSVFLIPWLAAIRPIATILIVPTYRQFLRRKSAEERSSSVQPNSTSLSAAM